MLTMNKTRVHELAQKMGIDNKELIARLKAVGVDVKSHMAIVSDEDIKKLTPSDQEVKETPQEEVRVKPTVIRRRPKAVPEAPPSAEEEAAPHEEPEEIQPILETGSVHEEVTAEPPSVSEAPVEPPAPEIEKPVEQPKPEPAAEKHVPGRARIIGRVEIPLPQQRPTSRTHERQSVQRQSAPPPERPQAVPVQEAPVTVDDKRLLRQERKKTASRKLRS